MVKYRKANKVFRDNHPEIIPPPARLAFDAYDHTNWQAYHDTGLKHSSLISELIKEYINEKEIKICEWGCGPARVIRHLVEIEGINKIQLVGTDYNKNTVNWCNKNIKNIRFLKNGLEPPLPIESETFDCVYAMSVFTHLSEKMHYAWIKELFRILKPDGILIFTTHGDLCAKDLLPEHKTLYDSGLLAVNGHAAAEGKRNFAVFHPPQFIREKLLKEHIVLKHIEDPSSYQLLQDVWVAKKTINRK